MAFLTVLSYSGGKQSKWALEKILRGEWKQPKRFAVVIADPGMEKQETKRIVSDDESRCERAGILFVRANGPNLYQDGLNVANSKRWDNPPLWVNNAGHRGQLVHSCTREYKIRPIRRATRKILESTRFWGSIKQPAAVEMWICFSANERSRIKRGDHPRWAVATHPLCEDGVTDDDIAADFRRWGIDPPPQSLCNGCPFHGLRSRAQQNGQDWEEAAKFDEAVRKLGHVGIKHECFTSDTLLPLVELQTKGFDLGNAKQNDLHGCSSGYCFV